MSVPRPRTQIHPVMHLHPPLSTPRLPLEGRAEEGILEKGNSYALQLLGYPEQALARLHEALALAHALSHPSSLAFVQCWTAVFSQYRRDVPAVHEQAEAG